MQTIKAFLSRAGMSKTLTSTAQKNLDDSGQNTHAITQITRNERSKPQSAKRPAEHTGQSPKIIRLTTSYPQIA